MSKVLVINVRFYDGRYHGAGDWPPAPARLFQAMIAGAGLRGVLDARVKQVLGQFELLEPPVIAAPFATKGQRVDNFVPNNDLDSAQGNPRNIGSIRSKKVIQPRIFDAGQVFRYAWTLPESEDAGLLESGLQDLAAGIYQLGRGVDLAWAWLEVLTAEDFDEGLRSYPGRVYRPGGSGEGTDVLTLNCPAPGSLASLERRYQAAAERFELFVAGRTVSQSFRQAPKAHFRGVVYDSPPARKLYELRELSAESPFAPWPVEKTVDLVERLRDLALDRLKTAFHEKEIAIERCLVGRRTDGTNDIPAAERVRIIPLPSIGHQYTQQSIRRVLVEVPAACPVRAEDVFWAFSGLELKKQEGNSVLLPAAALTFFEDNYRANDHTRLWRSITPLALPDSTRRRIDPKRQKEEAKDASEKAAEQAAARQAVVQALRHAGIGATVRGIRVQREPFQARGTRAECFAPGTRFSKHSLWHVEIDFSTPVDAPLILGNGRFLGLGLMAPMDGSDGAAPMHVARFLLRSAENLPPVTDTLPVAESARRALSCLYGRLSGEDGPGRYSKAFTGKDDAGQRLEGHGHCYFLPTDADGDGRLDQLTLFSAQGFTAPEIQALEQLREVHFADRDTHAAPLEVELLSLTRAGQSHDGPLANAAEWISATPFIAPRYPKTRGRDKHTERGNADPQRFLEAQLGDELRRWLARNSPANLTLADTAEITLLSETAQGTRPGDFRRARRKKGDDGGQRLAGFFRVRLREKIQGPLVLGHSSHFGMGLFLP